MNEERDESINKAIDWIQESVTGLNGGQEESMRLILANVFADGQIAALKDMEAKDD